jgi:putative folate metabolism gamma-glutamate ligase
MKVTSIKTEKITSTGPLTKILDTYISEFPENSILVITSKIVSICEGRVVKTNDADKHKLIEKEAELFIPPSESKYDVTLTIKHNLIVPSAGIDESNGNGYFILWPSDPQKTANDVREYLVRRFNISHAGVIVSDSRTSPLRWGTTGAAIAHSGFSALNNYIGTPDIFGRLLEMTKANIADGLAVSAVLVMGEGKEQTPLAVISDIPFVQFQNRNPSEKELKDLMISMKDDVYAPILTAASWNISTSKKQSSEK